MVNMKIHTWTLFSLCRTESSKFRLCTLMFEVCKCKVGARANYYNPKKEVENAV